jgi:hypothetical protein
MCTNLPRLPQAIPYENDVSRLCPTNLEPTVTATSRKGQKDQFVAGVTLRRAERWPSGVLSAGLEGPLLADTVAKVASERSATKCAKQPNPDERTFESTFQPSV